MHGKIGLGYNGEFANTDQVNGVPGISLKYGLTRDIAASLIFGINTGSPKNTVFGGKFFANIFYETALNFYFFLGGALVNGASSATATTSSGVDFISGFGAEFFIPGIESLGLSVETGASFNNISGSFAIRTLGVSFLDAGIHFYF